MSPAADRSRPARGTDLLLERCAAADETGEAREPAAERLEDAVGGELMRLLLLALTGDHRMRSRAPSA